MELMPFVASWSCRVNPRENLTMVLHETASGHLYFNLSTWKRRVGREVSHALDRAVRMLARKM